MVCYSYTEVSLALSRKETTTTVQCFVLDLTPLCQAINDHVLTWVDQFVNLLYSIALDTLQGLHNYMESNSER